eukprot:TRINITY_DN9808_c0_g1_i1.p1 TRINITY_DN9808_c0_g1~~TRINITY_DN9808_c0_g1_i1.p1  ORF type:complete len:148 (-),score=7.70 TRINITY_DN9808_c0_g1_i1:173-616(-)
MDKRVLRLYMPGHQCTLAPTLTLCEASHQGACGKEEGRTRKKASNGSILPLSAPILAFRLTLPTSACFSTAVLLQSLLGHADSLLRVALRVTIFVGCHAMDLGFEGHSDGSRPAQKLETHPSGDEEARKGHLVHRGHWRDAVFIHWE